MNDQGKRIAGYCCGVGIDEVKLRKQFEDYYSETD